MSDKAYKYVHVMNKPNEKNYFTENFANVNIGDYVGLVSATVTNIAKSGYIAYNIYDENTDKLIKGVYYPENYENIDIFVHGLKQYFLSVCPNLTIETPIYNGKERNFFHLKVSGTFININNFDLSDDLQKLLGLNNSTKEVTATSIYYPSYSYPFISINEIRIICDMAQFNERVYLDNELLLSTSCLAILNKSNEFKYQCFYLSHLSQIIKDPGNIKFEIVDENSKPITGISVSIELAFFHHSLHTKRRIIIPNLQFDKDYTLTMEAQEIAPFYTTSILVNNVINKLNSSIKISEMIVGELEEYNAKTYYLPNEMTGKIFDESLAGLYTVDINTNYEDLEQLNFFTENNYFIVRFPIENNLCDDEIYKISFEELPYSIFGMKDIYIEKEMLSANPKSVFYKDTNYMYIKHPLNIGNLRLLNETYIMKLANIYNDENVTAVFSASPDKNDVINNYYYCFRKMIRNNKLRFELYKRYTDDNGKQVEKKITGNNNYRINLWCYIK